MGLDFLSQRAGRLRPLIHRKCRLAQVAPGQTTRERVEHLLEALEILVTTAVPVVFVAAAEVVVLLALAEAVSAASSSNG